MTTQMLIGAITLLNGVIGAALIIYLGLCMYIPKIKHLNRRALFTLSFWITLLIIASSACIIASVLLGSLQTWVAWAFIVYIVLGLYYGLKRYNVGVAKIQERNYYTALNINNIDIGNGKSVSLEEYCNMDAWDEERFVWTELAILTGYFMSFFVTTFGNR